jgi:hypothetical protein
MIWRTRVSKSRLKASGVFPLPRGQPAATECQMGNWRSHHRFANSPEHENRRATLKTPARNCFSCHSLSHRLVSGYCGIENKSARAPPPPMAAIVAAGGTGEMYSLTPPRIWKWYGLWSRGGGRIPVIRGTGFNVAIGVDLARQSASMGAGRAIRTLTTKDVPSAMLLSFRPRLSRYWFIAATG